MLALICFVALRFYLQRQNKQLEMMEKEDSELSHKEVKKLEKTAEFEGIDMAAARVMQKGYRYML